MFYVVVTNTEAEAQPIREKGFAWPGDATNVYIFSLEKHRASLEFPANVPVARRSTLTTPTHQLAAGFYSE